LLLTATDTLTEVRESAVALRDSAESFIAQLDSVIAGAPKDLGEIMDALKSEVIGRLAGEDVARPRAGRPRAQNKVDGVQCPHCTKVLKNDLGLSIHLGREHSDITTSKKAAAAKRRGKRRAAKAAAEKATVSSTPETVETSAT
jgi:hypothetical protein